MWKDLLQSIFNIDYLDLCVCMWQQSAVFCRWGASFHSMWTQVHEGAAGVCQPFPPLFPWWLSLCFISCRLLQHSETHWISRLLHHTGWEIWWVIHWLQGRKQIRLFVGRWECYQLSFWLLDVNECMDLENECTQLCNNYIGGYRCFCRPGYILDSDKHTCQGNEWDFETRFDCHVDLVQLIM